jgi:hypothetical protein
MPLDPCRASPYAGDAQAHKDHHDAGGRGHDILYPGKPAGDIDE